MNFRNAFYCTTHWEAWDWRIKYIPLIPLWFWYCLKSRSLWFFTPSNPGLVFGGFDGVSKKLMYELLPPGSYPKGVCISHLASQDEVEKIFASQHFQYPAVVKPDEGRMGLMFRKVHKREDLLLYHATMPSDYILQEFIPYPIEVSVFYYRHPDDLGGTITGFLRKEYMIVTGDGQSTLNALMDACPHARLHLKELKSKHVNELDEVLQVGKEFYLSHALNLSRGGKLVNLELQKDKALLQVFDNLSHCTQQLYYGRYDIKCVSIEDLKRGENFIILEYNGSGGEPHHVYGNGNTLLRACIILAQHWHMLFVISKRNHEKGVAYWNFLKGLKFFIAANKHIRMLKKLDARWPVNEAA